MITQFVNRIRITDNHPVKDILIKHCRTEEIPAATKKLDFKISEHETATVYIRKSPVPHHSTGRPMRTFFLKGCS
jgi:hypothetical protein